MDVQEKFYSFSNLMISQKVVIPAQAGIHPAIGGTQKMGEKTGFPFSRE